MAKWSSGSGVSKILGNMTAHAVKIFSTEVQNEWQGHCQTGWDGFHRTRPAPQLGGLKYFIQDTLKLKPDEFNRESPAGKSNKEPLLEMLDSACFAFLVMTAEDEKTDGTKHARENVIHEAGLFQGRLGFERAIILLMAVPSSLMFTASGKSDSRLGNIMAKSEEIRKVLDREKIL